MTDYDKALLKIRRAKTIEGEVVLPGSKSIANRSLLLSALAGGTTVIHNLPDSDDVRVLKGALPGLGVGVETLSGEETSGKTEPVSIRGAGGIFPVHRATLNLENAGTALRPMVAVLAASRGEFVVDGNDHMRKRPIGDLVESIRKLGIDISASSTGCPPVRIKTEGLKGGVAEVSGKVSSQYLSALLISAPLSPGGLTVKITDELVSKPYVDITLRMMEDFGVRVKRDGYKSFQIEAGSFYTSPGEYYVEGDASAATYFLGAGALPGSGPVVVHGVDDRSIQGDIHFTEILEQMGAKIEFGKKSVRVTGPGAERKLRALDVDMNAMPDAAMTLAVLALFADGTTHIRNIANLRVKESERIAGIRNELIKLGAEVVEKEDSLSITPPAKTLPAKIETYHDHRMAMAFSLAAFATEIEIIDPACVSKTYPGYFNDFIPMLKY